MNAFAAIDAMDAPLTPALDSRIFVQPFDRAKASENTRQWEWVKHMRQHARQIVVFAVPNGTHIGSHAGRAKVQREGLYKGFPDTGAIWSGQVAYLEWKDGNGDPSNAQIECLNRLAAMGHSCGIFRTMECAIGWLADLGAPVRRLS